VPSLVAFAALALERNDRVLAQKALDQALSVDPAHVPATLLRIRIATEEGSLSFARRTIERLLHIVPDDPDLHEARAGVLHLQGEHEQALAELDLVDRLKESGPIWRTSYHRGLILEAGGRLDEARELYRRSLEENPGFEPASRRWRWLESHSDGSAADPAPRDP
jgi:tetratricopeptide (TPR) repeat protein